MKGEGTNRHWAGGMGDALSRFDSCHEQPVLCDLRYVTAIYPLPKYHPNQYFYVFNQPGEEHWNGLDASWEQTCSCHQTYWFFRDDCVSVRPSHAIKIIARCLGYLKASVVTVLSRPTPMGRRPSMSLSLADYFLLSKLLKLATRYLKCVSSLHKVHPNL